MPAGGPTISTPFQLDELHEQLGTRASALVHRTRSTVTQISSRIDLHATTSRIREQRPDPRVGLHVAVVAVVVSCAVAGGSFAVLPSQSTPQPQRAALPGPVVAAPAVAAVATAQPQTTAPIAAAPATAVTSLSATAPTRALAVAPAPAEDQLRVALGLPDPGSASKIADGVVAARPLTSSKLSGPFTRASREVTGSPTHTRNPRSQLGERGAN